MKKYLLTLTLKEKEAPDEETYRVCNSVDEEELENHIDKIAERMDVYLTILWNTLKKCAASKKENPLIDKIRAREEIKKCASHYEEFLKRFYDV